MEKQFALEHHLSISYAESKVEAYLECSKSEEGFECTVLDLEQFLKENQIVHGLKPEALQRFAQKPDFFYGEKLLIAAGTRPTDGKNGSIRYAFEQESEKELRPREDSKGTVDYKEVTKLNNVKAGQILAELIPAEPGLPGISVTGEEVPPRPVKEARFKIGKNVVVNPEGNAMYAAIDGIVTFTDKQKVNVFPIYEINGDIDYSVGNIDFVGTVIVRGNVLTGFRIRAHGDIRVIGGVEGAELEAGGSIEITGGIIGYHKGHVKAVQNVKSSFIQDANVSAGADVIVSQSIMHSEIRAGHDVICSGAKGLIVGGNIQAGQKVTARTVGNTMSTPTSIEVGVLPELRNELTELRAKMRLLNENLDKTIKALHILDQLAAAGQLSPDKVGMRVKLKATQKSHQKEQADARERILEIESTLEDTSLARVNVESIIYGGSKIVIGRYTKFIKDPVSRMSFYYFEGDITMTPRV
ncbi:FapA family protein [Paenibacillus sp. JX-17]|uniref:FapA family protein n=1 Tax=Paenibacillus lacisoli TaxID=3064525 RepID=A0ABT9C993_9BACL|nr:FapA family protein [Paenibacillus sp. JX-17]MDO7905806.1 FapA family protein [Paenibacillus sp. JX-17]